MRIRAVADFRSRKPKQLAHITLLAASWARHARSTAPLEIIAIGEPPEVIGSFIESTGAELVPSKPHPNDSFSITSNTILGTTPVKGERILLVDADVIFTGSIDPLLDLPPDKVFGAPSCSVRVSPEQWDLIAEELGLQAFPTAPVFPSKETLRTEIDPDYPRSALNQGYVNGGVLLFPANYDFGRNWADHQRRIREFFSNHPMGSKSVTGSNMAALATTIGSYGKFEWLPMQYNYRHASFALGHSDAEEIRIVHMTGRKNDEVFVNLSRWVSDFWFRKVLSDIRRLEHQQSGELRERERFIVQKVEKNILDLIDEYDLDWVVQDCSQTKSAIANRAKSPLEIISYPKSGRTWLKMLIASYLCQFVENGVKHLQKLKNLCTLTGVPEVRFSHLDSQLDNATHYDHSQPTNQIRCDRLRNSRVILLTRNIEDLLVSAYHHARFRNKQYIGSISEFIRDPDWGIDPILNFYQSWEYLRDCCSTFNIIRYEDLHADTTASLSLVLQQIGVDSPHPGAINQAVEFCRFSNLQKLESTEQFTTNSLRAGDIQIPESYKFRRGRIGGFRDFLADSDISYISQRIKQSNSSLVTSSLL